MITKVGEEGAFISATPKLLRANHNNFLIAKHEGITSHLEEREVSNVTF